MVLTAMVTPPWLVMTQNPPRRTENARPAYAISARRTRWRGCGKIRGPFRPDRRWPDRCRFALIQGPITVARRQAPGVAAERAPDGRPGRSPAARPRADAEGGEVVDPGTGGGVAPRIVVPARGLPVRAARPAGLLAGRDAGGAGADDRFDADGAERRAAQFLDRGTDRTVWPRVPRARRPGQGHGLGRGVRADVERVADLGAAARPPPALTAPAGKRP